MVEKDELKMRAAQEPITDAALRQLKLLVVEYNTWLPIGRDLFDAFPAILARLEAAERKCDELRVELKEVSQKWLNKESECNELLLIKAERDKLRSDLNAANEHSEHQSKEICQWADALYIGTWPLSKEDTANTGFYGRLAAKMTKERNAAVERAEKAEKELSEVKEFIAKLGDAVFESAERGNLTLRLAEAQLNNASRNAKYYADKYLEMENHLYKLRELIEDWKDNGEFDWSHPREAAIANYLIEVDNAKSR